MRRDQQIILELLLARIPGTVSTSSHFSTFDYDGMCEACSSQLMPIAFNNKLFPSLMLSSNNVTFTACHLTQSCVSNRLVSTSYQFSMSSPVIRDDIHVPVPSYVNSGTMPCLLIISRT